METYTSLSPSSYDSVHNNKARELKIFQAIPMLNENAYSMDDSANMASSTVKPSYSLNRKSDCFIKLETNDSRL